MTHEPRRYQAGTSLRHKAERDKRRQQYSGVARDHLIAMQKHGGTDADRGTAHGGDQGLFTARQCMEEPDNRDAEAASLLPSSRNR